MPGLIAFHLKCLNVVSTHQSSRRLRTGADSQSITLTIGAAVDHRQCMVIRLHTMNPFTAACQLHPAGLSHSRYRRPRAMSPVQYTARQTYTLHSCRGVLHHATPPQTAWTMDRHRRLMLRRTAGKVCRACSSRDLGTFLEHRCMACLSHWMRRWKCRLITHVKEQ